MTLSPRIVACFGVAHGTLDLAAAKERGVVVTNTPDSSADAVADLAMGMIVAVMRRICESDRFVRAGKWPEGPFPPGAKIGGKTCGIIGLGNIARGAIVDEPALITALREGWIAGAGLDVFAAEPRVPPELIAMDNVVLLAHIGTSTREIREERSEKLLANLRAHFAGKPVLTPVT